MTQARSVCEGESCPGIVWEGETGMFIRIRRQALQYTILIVLPVSASATECKADERADARAKRVDMMWQERREWFEGIRYTLEGVATYPRGGMTNPDDREAHRLIRQNYPEHDV